MYRLREGVPKRVYLRLQTCWARIRQNPAGDVARENGLYIRLMGEPHWVE